MRVPRVPGPSSTRALMLLSATLAVAPAVAAAPASAAPLSSWAERPGQFFVDVDYATPTTVARGRLWQVSFMRSKTPVLRSRRLTDGRATPAVEVAVPRPPGGDLLSESLGGEDAQLFVAGHQAFMTGSWCTERDEETSSNDCLSQESFYVRFSTRTGKVFQRAVTREPRRLVGGTRVTYVSAPESGSVVLRDAITRRTVHRLPSNARNIQGAGRFVAWKIPTADGEGTSASSGDVGPWWSVLRVRERGTDRGYDLRQAAVRRAVQPRGVEVLVQESNLATDGSLGLEVDVDLSRSFRPVVVDARGRIRRATERPMRNRVLLFSTEVRGDRALLTVQSNDDSACLSRSPIGWLTDLGGHRGVDLGALPHSSGRRASSGPSFLTATTMSWSETKPGRPYASHVRVGHDVRKLPLAARYRPRC